MIRRAILAGGLSTRFGSNKAIFKHRDLALISTVVLEMLKIRGKTSPIIVSVHDEAQEREIFSAMQKDLGLSNPKRDGSLLVEGDESHPPVPILPVHDPSGILDKTTRASVVGLFSIFKEVGSGPVQVVPCDTPFFSAQAMSVIATAYIERERNTDAIIPRWSNGFIEPLHGIFRVEAFLPYIEKNMRWGELRLRKLLDAGPRVTYLDIETCFMAVDPALRMFDNINEKDHLR